MIFPMTEEAVKRVARTWCRENGHDPDQDAEDLQEAEAWIRAANEIYRRGYAAGIAAAEGRQ